MSSNLKTLLTPEEYLTIERKAEYRSEYYAGEMLAMAGATRRHNRIVSNLVIRLGVQLEDLPCNIYSTGMRVKVPATGLYTYPDLVVTCGEELFDGSENDVLLNPLLIIEVLSDSTRLTIEARSLSTTEV
jgi:Uma2 family endonuclease